MTRKTVTAIAAMTILVGAPAAAAAGSGMWRVAQDIEQFKAGAHPNFNTASVEGCPFISADGKRMFIASNRPGGLGQLDVWVSTRKSTKHPWSQPVNPGAPINSAANDFCPTIAPDGKTFFFVSTRSGHCGATPNGDIYTARLDKKSKARKVHHLGCTVNSAWDEHSPFPTQLRGMGKVLLYSSARPANHKDAAGDHDLYASPWRGKYRAGVPLKGINTTTANEGQPNLSTNGKELFFWSDRVGTLGGPDIYSSTLLKSGKWSTPKNLGPKVNSPAGETRPSLSRDGRTLYFGSTRNGGQSDIFVTTR